MKREHKDLVDDNGFINDKKTDYHRIKFGQPLLDPEVVNNACQSQDFRFGFMDSRCEFAK